MGSQMKPALSWGNKLVCSEAVTPFGAPCCSSSDLHGGWGGVGKTKYTRLAGKRSGGKRNYKKKKKNGEWDESCDLL